ncbi:MAG TPA: tetratricopeptide repeat protein [Holophagaceae bacterium]|nr:tetratricopeptide repeat protein [Holophagaceae bacterium]
MARPLPLLRMAALGLAAALALAAQNPAVAAPPPVPEPPAVALAHRVEHLKDALEKGQPDQVDAALAEVETLRRNYTSLDVMPLVDAMALWARQQGAFGHPKLGLSALDKVERWAPQDPAILSSRIVLTRELGIEGWLWSIPDLLRLTAKRLEHPAHRWLWLVQHLGGIRLMATLLLWGWALTLAFRHRNVLRDLWEERLRAKGLSAAVLAAVGALILAGPVLLGLDPSVAALFWLLLLAPFMSTAEVRSTVLVLLLQLLNPLMAVMEPWAVQPPAPSLVTLQIQPQIEPPGEARLRLLPPADRTFLEGWRQLQAQDWTHAEATFKKLVGVLPDQAPVLNNLGVAEFMQGRTDEAEKHFQAAYQMDPGRAEVLMNESILDFDKLDTVGGALKQEAARAADPAMFSELALLNEAKGAATGHRVYPSPLPDTPDRVKALKNAEGEADKAAGPWNARIALGLLVPLLALMLLLWRYRRARYIPYSTQCIRCGDPFRSTDSPHPQVCSQCHHLFVVKDGVHAESRKRKVDQLAAHQRATRWIHRFLIVFLPGCDVAFLGDTSEGFWEWFMVCLALGIVIATGPTVRYPGEILPDPLSLWLPLGAAFLALLYLRSWVKLLPKRRP